jgi:hypothetical protein
VFSVGCGRLPDPWWAVYKSVSGTIFYTFLGVNYMVSTESRLRILQLVIGPLSLSVGWLGSEPLEIPAATAEDGEGK